MTKDCKHERVDFWGLEPDGTPFRLSSQTCPDCGETQLRPRPSDQIRERGEELFKQVDTKGYNDAEMATAICACNFKATWEYLDTQAGFTKDQ